eukprot:CAMPEP_0185844648 /NCGR_PEP_ID=MMETSP1354-20130828/762_1 /TAXON_ID=708628 /ORGANISM="Erythrolobus madagascarensis, Strain CCMP3276" /LENGTH=209 /DNA_ID=CAMNT_0028544367 /DNA_START=303 /DNA_END=928 /DNA_ORIENTATION=+
MQQHADQSVEPTESEYTEMSAMDLDDVQPIDLEHLALPELMNEINPHLMADMSRSAPELMSALLEQDPLLFANSRSDSLGLSTGKNLSNDSPNTMAATHGAELLPHIEPGGTLIAPSLAAVPQAPVPSSVFPHVPTAAAQAPAAASSSSSKPTAVGASKSTAAKTKRASASAVGGGGKAGAQPANATANAVGSTGAGSNSKKRGKASGG